MTEKGKRNLAVLMPMAVCLIFMAAMMAFGAHTYRQTAFEHLSKFCEILLEENPESEVMVLSALKKYHALTAQEIGGAAFLAQYGYQSRGFGSGISGGLFIFAAALFGVAACGFLFPVWYLNRRSRMRITELTDYLEQVNTGAAGTLIQTKEDDFSRLQDEIYKTVTSLYQTREAAVRAKANFADNLANIAHQVKTSITAALLSLQLMEKKTPNCYIEPVGRQLFRLSRLEEALLTLSEIDAGTLHLENSRVDLYTALNLAADQLDDLMKKENISVDIPDHGCIEICGDMEWTMEALMNLMKNCMEHSVSGGTIHCDYSGNPLYAEIRIWDDGVGFEAEDIPHLFERFYRGKGAAGNGIGIGLSLARSVFELQNGNITAQNLPDGGACFEIRVYSH